MTDGINIDLEVFIHGETVDLCIPTELFASQSNWYSWFNNKEIVRFLEQGLYPNTKKLQTQFFKNLGADRLTLIMVNKKKIPVGVISLSFINLNKKSCDIALVVSNDGDKKEKPFLSLESMALMTEHAFENLGMKRINAGQHIKLKGWQNRLELIGYKLEGLHSDKFVKGANIADSISICASFDDYIGLKAFRSGHLWDSLTLMRSRLKALPKDSYCDKLIRFIEKTRTDYYNEIFKL